MTNKKDNTGIKVGLSAAALALAATVVGAYYLYGSKDALKNRAKVRGWMLKARGEVLEKIENLKDTLTEENYSKIIDSVVGKYASVKEASKAETDALARELKSHWKNIKKHFTTVKPMPVKKTRKNKK